MRDFIIFMLTFISAFLFYSCDPCSNLDCAASNYSGQFRIIRATDNMDLVFGPGRVYDKRQIKFYSIKGTDTTLFDYQTVRSLDVRYDSVLYILFYPKVDTAYIRLSNGDVDTLKISYKMFDTKCCGTITEITSFKFNNSIDFPADKGPHEIKK